MQALAHSYSLPFYIQPRKNSERFIEFTKLVDRLHPDIIIVNSYSMLLPKELLALPTHGVVNIHGALLPQYRGANPVQWAIINAEKETGVTMHYMTEQFDTGDIIAQRRVPIYFEDTWIDIQNRISVAAEQMLAEEIPKILASTHSRQPQDETQARYFNRRHPEDGLIDWNQSVFDIYNLIRALVKPHPGAFYHQNGFNVIIDDYQSIFQVTNMKYGEKGRQELKSKQIKLKPLTHNDVPIFLEWSNDCEQILFNAIYKHVSESEHIEWFESIQRRNDTIIFGIWSLEAKQMIGFCQLKDFNLLHQNAELQIRIGEMEMRGNGLGTEAVSLLLKFAFNDLNLHRVFVHVFSSDQRAIRIYEKNSLIIEGKMREAAFIDGNYMDMTIMGVLKHEFNRGESSGYSPA